MGNFVDSDRDSDYSGSYGNSDDSNGDGSDEDSNEEEEEQFDYGMEDDEATGNVKRTRLEKEKEWLDSFIRDKLKKSIAKVEAEVDNIRNKKIRGTSKK